MFFTLKNLISCIYYIVDARLNIGPIHKCDQVDNNCFGEQGDFTRCWYLCVQGEILIIYDGIYNTISHMRKIRRVWRTNTYIIGRLEKISDFDV